MRWLSGRSRGAAAATVTLALHAMLVSPCRAADSPAQQPSTASDKALFRFLFCSDLHISSESHARSFGVVVDSWLRDTACYDFVVVGGDLVNDGTTRELALVKRQLDRIPRPVYVIPGNHDLSDSAAAGRKAWREVFGVRSETYLVNYRGYALAFLDVSNGKRATMLVPEGTKIWARKNLPRLRKGTPLIVITHASLHPDIPRFPMSGTEELFDILDTLNVRACFSGHYHALWRGLRNGAHYYNTTCLSPAEDNHDGSSLEGFLWASAYADSVHVDFVEAGGLLPSPQPCERP